MITVIHKINDEYPVFQIWRDSNYDFSFTHSRRGQINPETFNINGTKHVTSGNYSIELTNGPDFVDPRDYI
jgi:hypothetical protein